MDKGNYSVDILTSNSIFTIDNTSVNERGYDLLTFGYPGVNLLEIRTEELSTAIKDIDCVYCKDMLEEEFEIKKENSELEKLEYLNYVPFSETYDEETGYRGDFTLYFDRNNLNIVFDSPVGEDLASYVYEEDRLAYYLTKHSELLCIQIKDLNEQEFESLRSKKGSRG